jgi:heat shock protein HtpX
MKRIFLLLATNLAVLAVLTIVAHLWMARNAMGVRVISQATTPTERWLVDLVARLARAANVGMPELPT